MSIRRGFAQVCACRSSSVTPSVKPTQIHLPKTWRRWSSISQRPGSDRVHFPGAVNSKFTNTLSVISPDSNNALPTYRVLDQDGNIVDQHRPPISISSEDILKWYTDMLTVSIMDTIMFDAQRQGRLSFYMVSAGEEGIAVGSASALIPQDVIFAQYRETGVFQYRGFTLHDFMSQLFANKSDAGLGRNMPVHYGSRTLNIHTISSPLATQIPQAAGAAYALKLQDLSNPDISSTTTTSSSDPSKPQRRVVACYFGEGAASEGDFHGALNIAATRSCPVLFICRNNGYAISTSTLEQYRGDGIASRGIGYGIDTIRVDGNDIFAVHEATARARELCLQDGGKPVLMECMSYRVSHHSTSDDSYAYRAKVEVEDWKRRDNPITRLRKYMEGRGLWSEEKEQEARSRIRKEVLKAFAEAEKEKRPRLRSMFEDVYAEVTEEQESHIQELKGILEKYPEEYDLGEFDEGVKGLDKAKT